MDVRSLKDEAAELFRKGRFAKAAERYDALAKAEPKDAQHLIKLGDSLRRDGKREHAITAYCKAVDMYAQQGIVIKAIAACKLVLEIDPEQKAVQEALANLCARRYVRRDQVEAPPPTPPAPKARSYEAIELPDDDEVSSSPIETAGGETLEVDDAGALDFDDGESLELDPPVPPARSQPRPPPIRPPPPPPPPRREEPPASVELIELDLGETPAASSAPEPDVLELDLGAAQVVEDVPPEPDSIELDLDMPVAAPQEDLGEVIELMPLEEPVAKNTTERRVLRDADVAARQPVTAMADILSDSLLIEGEVEDGEEIELLSITTGEPGLVSAAEFSEPEDEEVELVALPEPQPAPPPPARTEDLVRERQEMRRIANEAAFDVTPPPTPVDEAPPEPEDVDLEPQSERTPGAEVSQHDVPLFSELPHDAFIDLLEKVAFRRLDQGEVILREGDSGRSIFVLASGRARVVKAHGTPNAIELAVLEDGSFFGEMALLTGAARVASVVADDDCEVLELTEDLLRDLTAKHPSVAHSLKKFYRQRLLSNVMAISPLFRAFDKSDRKMLVEKFKLREMKPGEPVIREGDRPDGLYVVMHGVCLVTRTAPDGSRQVPLAVLREGDVFGEMSLLSRQPASATVTAKRRTLVLRLPKSVFDELMFTHPAVLEVVSELTDQRTRVNDDILSGRVQVSDEVLALV